MNILYMDLEKIILKLKQDNYLILGTDVHRQNTIYANMNTILKELRKVINDEKIELLTEINPRKIINNEEIIIEQPQKIKKGFFSK